MTPPIEDSPNQEVTAKPQPTQATTELKANPTPLDAIFILFASVTLLLLLLWIVTGGRNFQNGPPFLHAIVSNAWEKIVGGLSGSAGVFLLRHFFDRSPAPNYLIWIPSFTGILAVGILLVALVMAALGRILPTPPASSILVPVHFNLDRQPDAADPSLAKYTLADLNFWVDSPQEMSVHGLYRGNRPTYPYSDTLAAEDGKSSKAYIKLLPTFSRTPGSNNTYDYNICLDLNPRQPQPPSAGPAIWLSCARGVCVPAAGDDFGYMVACSDRATTHAGLLSVAWASETIEKQREEGWDAPSLATLEKITDRERVGYTSFGVAFTPQGKAAAADSFYFVLRVNDRPIYIDGLSPQLLKQELKSDAENDIAFALENLNFIGQYAGYEKLQLKIVFLKSGNILVEQPLERRYVALRPAPEVAIATETGKYVWSGKYVIPKNQNKYEVMLASSVSVDLAETAKAQFSFGDATYNGRQVVMIVRPPLPPNKNWGLALGYVLPTSQVQFTFNETESRDFCNWALKQVGQGKSGRLIRKDVYQYDVATRGYTPCG